jgi:hypothetical protein
MSSNELKPQENIKEYIRVIFLDNNDKQIKSNRDDKYETTVEWGYEDLNLKTDSTKINLYNTAEYIELWGNRRFKVIKRTLMPCCPVCLYLTLEEE